MIRSVIVEFRDLNNIALLLSRCCLVFEKFMKGGSCGELNVGNAHGVESERFE